MTLYEYECGVCDHVEEEVHKIADRHTDAPVCHGRQMKLSIGASAIEIFKPMVYHDIDVYPIMVTSKRQLRDECKKRGVTACRLM